MYMITQTHVYIYICVATPFDLQHKNYECMRVFVLPNFTLVVCMCLCLCVVKLHISFTNNQNNRLDKLAKKIIFINFSMFSKFCRKKAELEADPGIEPQFVPNLNTLDLTALCKSNLFITFSVRFHKSFYFNLKSFK
jgi:hypothetical protein